MKTPSLFSKFSILAFATVVAGASHAAVMVASTADAQINSDGTQNNTDYQARVGEFYYPGGSSYVAPFLLPTLGVGEVFTSANLRVQLFGLPAILPSADADLYGLGRRASDTVLASDYYSGPLDTTDATLIQAGIFDETMSLGLKYTDAGGDAALVAYLNSQYANGAGAGQYVFLRISYGDVIPNSNTAYAVLTQNAGGETERPELNYTAGVIPEPASVVLLIGGLGATLFFRRRN